MFGNRYFTWDRLVSGLAVGPFALGAITVIARVVQFCVGQTVAAKVRLVSTKDDSLIGGMPEAVNT